MHLFLNFTQSRLQLALTLLIFPLDDVIGTVHEEPPLFYGLPPYADSLLPAVQQQLSSIDILVVNV